MNHVMFVSDKSKEQYLFEFSINFHTCEIRRRRIDYLLGSSALYDMMRSGQGTKFVCNKVGEQFWLATLFVGL